jgi:hypothetical protein
MRNQAQDIDGSVKVPPISPVHRRDHQADHQCRRADEFARAQRHDGGSGAVKPARVQVAAQKVKLLAAHLLKAKARSGLDRRAFQERRQTAPFAGVLIQVNTGTLNDGSIPQSRPARVRPARVHQLPEKSEGQNEHKRDCSLRVHPHSS